MNLVLIAVFDDDGMQLMMGHASKMVSSSDVFFAYMFPYEIKHVESQNSVLSRWRLHVVLYSNG